MDSPTYADTFDPAVIATIIGEAGGDPDGQRAVASVIRNRADSSGMSQGDVVRAPNQFAGLRSRNAIMDSSAPVYQQAAANVGPILNGVDAPTVDATHFYSGAAVPPWAVGRPAQNIGGNKFVNVGYAPPNAPEADQGGGDTQLDESVFGDGSQPQGQDGSQPQAQAQSGLDESVFGDAPNAAPPPKPGDGSVVAEDTQAPLNAAQTATLNAMRSRFDPNAPAGSANRPYHAETPDMVAGVPAGSWYVDSGGNLSQKPGATQSNEMLGVQTGAEHVLNNAALAVDTGLRAAGGLVGAPNWTDDLSHAIGQPGVREAMENQAKALQAKAAQGIVPGKIGNFIGEAGATGLGVGALGGLGLLPTAGVGGAIAGGAAGGALATNDRDPLSVIKDAAAGAVTGGVLHVGLNGLGSFLAPQYGPDAQYLLDRGVTLTPGGAAGGLAKAMEDKFTSFPHYFLGDSIAAAKKASLESYNRGAANEALTPLGQKLPANVAAGHDAVAFVKQAAGQAYDNALPNMNLRLNQHVVGDLGNIKSQAFTRLPDAQKSQFDAIMRDNILNNLTGSNMAGKDFKVMDSNLGNEASNYSTSMDRNDQRLGQALYQVKDALRGHFAAQNPAYASDLQNADAAYAMYSRLRDAAGKVGAGANEGRFTPAQLLSAVRNGDKSFAHGAFSQGDALLQDYAQAGIKTVPSNVPDSGTAGRMKLTWADILGAPAFAPASALYGTRGGRAILNNITAARAPEPLNAIARSMKANTGLFGSMAPVIYHQSPEAAPPLSLYPLVPNAVPTLPSPR